MMMMIYTASWMSMFKLKSILWRLHYFRKKKVAAELKQRKRNYKKSLDDLRHCQKLLERVRSERVRLFMRCYEHISAEIDSIYKVCVLQTVASLLPFILLQSVRFIELNQTW